MDMLLASVLTASIFFNAYLIARLRLKAITIESLLRQLRAKEEQLLGSTRRAPTGAFDKMFLSPAPKRD